MATPAKKIRLNVLDRAISEVFPSWGLQRMRARATLALAGGYFGGGKRRKANLADWNPGAGDANADISPDLVDLRSLSRDLARTSPMAGGAISTVVTNVVGTGLSMRPAIDWKFLGMTEEEARAWQDDTMREFCSWAESQDCDITRTQNFYGLQSLAFRSALESGDTFIVLPRKTVPGSSYGLKLQLVEADRVSNPNRAMDTDTLVAGVEMDADGAPVRYHISSKHPGSLQCAGMTWTPVPAFGEKTGRRNVLHLFDKRRPGQARGVPYLASVIEPLKQLTRYTEAELGAAVLNAAFAIFMRMDHEAFEALFESDEQNAYIEAASKWNGAVSGASLDAPNKVVNLLPGEEPVMPDMKRPNVAFDPFFQAIVRQIGVGLELPFEVLIKHFTASYSAARAALLDAWRFFRGRRDFLATYFCQPVYETWLAEAVSIGRIAAPGFFLDASYRHAWSKAVWTGDGPGSIDPYKEVMAAEKRIANAISTVDAEAVAFDGIGFDVKLAQRRREQQMMVDAGLTQPAPGQAAPDNTMPSDQPGGSPT